MQALTAEQYARLQQLARAWERRHLKAAKAEARYNPRLGVDALCFQPHALEEGREVLIGALITPLSLSLILVPVRDEPPAAPETRQRVSLPSGDYPFCPLALEDQPGLWACELLDDLSDVGSLQEGSRLAQQLMERVMTASG
ncbi:[NiFe]-hydrogenase assembly chaperone HybE [Halomonas nitroreducens]|nr:[NiFe]-hydrogenase assembly chaperone HybE [Halomonas nitroreducens]